MCPVPNQFALLTPPGKGALHVVAIRYPDNALKQKMASHFRPAHANQSSLKLGVLTDDDNVPVDELLMETRPDEVLFHIHGGHLTLLRLHELMTAWGCVQEQRDCPRSLREEGLWALEKAHSSQALEVALTAFSDLMTVEPSNDLLNSLAYGLSLFEPVRYVLVGASNAGKSSFLNRLAGHQRMVVSPEAGTTRDAITLEITVDDRVVEVVDGAGFREEADDLERRGQAMLLDRARQSRVIWVVNPHAPSSPCPVAQPEALLLTHQDQGAGKRPLFEGPCLQTGLGDEGQSFLDFVRHDLPARVEGPVLFTQRQKEVMQKALEVGDLDREQWVG